MIEDFSNINPETMHLDADKRAEENESLDGMRASPFRGAVWVCLLLILACILAAVALEKFVASACIKPGLASLRNLQALLSFVLPT